MSVVAIARGWPVWSRPGVLRAVGGFALAVSVCCSVWLAVGAADGRYWLHLPGGANPAWIDGPLRGLASVVGSLPPARLSAALVLLGLAYLAALACARVGAISLRAALVAVVAVNLAFTLGPTLVSSDVFGYIAYGRLVAVHGLDPYASAPMAAPHDAILPFVYWRGATSPYGPLFTLISAPVGLVSGGAALWVFKALAGIASVGLTALVGVAARRRGVNAALAAIFVGLNPVMLFYAVSGAHNDLLGMALVMAAIALVLERRAASAGVALVCAAAIKVTLGLALPFLILGARARRRAVTGALAAVAVIGVPSLAIFGTHLFDQLGRISSDPMFDIRFSGPDRLASLLGSPIGTGVRLTALVVFAVSVCVAVAWAWRGGDWITACGWATVGLIASIASLAPWYLVWLLPLAALGRSRALRGAALALTAYLIAVHLPALGGAVWLTSAGG